ncbi:MAG: tRNA (adenosine(37)-N6)-threonylcarbamoyltransferase complex dimerization subunit type 1 TsaB [Rhizobiaceae bacterium]|nr:tRNA (adenosine(37)-N6)-threonylcarbamoyltransferase complex dimerization subunit type 1 TsaB [Rhizobiaceae bacterium]
MLILALDTASSLCSVCLHDAETGRTLHAISEDLGTGHAVRLMPMVVDVLSASNATLRDVGLVACSIGPGSFTGVRVGVAAARGLAQATGLPGIGVTTLAALATDALPLADGKPVRVMIDARRDAAHVQDFSANGAPLSMPELLPLGDAARTADGFALAGSGAALVSQDALLPSASTGTIEAFARLAAAKLAIARPQSHGSNRAGVLGEGSLTMRPLYLRGADAKPQEGFALARR